MSEPIEVAKTISPQAFHKISGDLDDCLRELRVHAGLLTPEQVKVMSDCIKFKQFGGGLNVNEVDRQYHLFLKMQEQVVDPEGTILAGASIRDVGSVIATMSSLISLFLKAQKDLDIIRDQSDLKDAVLGALKDAPEDVRQKFFAKLAEQES